MAGGAIVGALAAIWVLVAPELSTRAVARAYRQFDDGNLSGAAASARRAQSLNPLSTAPLSLSMVAVAGSRRARSSR